MVMIIFTQALPTRDIVTARALSVLSSTHMLLRINEFRQSTMNKAFEFRQGTVHKAIHAILCAFMQQRIVMQGRW